jgi:transcriptional regulator GlxA family with amidase domain
MGPESLVPALAGSEVREAGEVLRKWSGRGALTATACVGTFVLAEAALLDGEEATMTWWLSPLFRQRYPRVRLDESRILVQSNTMFTAGAALSHLDLALALIRRATPQLADLTARYLVVDMRTSQSIYSVPHHLANADPLMQRFERWARGRLARGFSLEGRRGVGYQQAYSGAPDGECARQVALPFFQDLRIERSVHLLRTSQASVDQIAAEVGYGGGVTLRALLRRKLGRGVNEIRRGP